LERSIPRESGGERNKKLIEAGINVTVGVLESECHELNKRFLLFIKRKDPT
jgi:diaminohydroxyphosphoribosylaminopyrimidine deaminase/5-amino-6-(5-phosphoribosylamino)uracil reductase